MRRLGDLLTDLGFNKDAPLDSQKALFRHLVRSANVRPATVSPPTKPLVEGEQLTFDLEILGASVQKKAGGR